MVSKLISLINNKWVISIQLITSIQIIIGYIKPNFVKTD